MYMVLLYSMPRRKFSLVPFFVVLALFVAFPIPASAGPSSTNYELEQYGFDSGGGDNSTSSNFNLFGEAGGLELNNISSTNYAVNAGLTETLQTDVPSAPTFTNPATNYDRLKCVINTGDNPTDTLYAIAISDDDFTTTNYVQNDNTIGPILGSEDWQTYSNWGGSTGVFIRSLTQDTTYRIKVKAKRGDFTESDYGPTASATTSVPSMTFGISAANLAFNNLNSGNNYTDDSKSTTLTTSTNAYNGYAVYGRETGPLSFASETIPDYSSPNSSPTVWSNTGFGYTTNDNSLSGGTSDRFTSGGPKYAGFPTSIPGDPVADHTGPIEDNPIVNEQFTISYRVSGDNTTKAGNYTNTVTYVVVPIY